MTADELKDICLCGETTKVQFKEAPIPQKELAREMIAFANSKGGVILFGVADKTGDIKGLSYEEIQETSRELGNAANEQVKPTIYIETEVVCVDGKHVLACTIAEGRNKPLPATTSATPTIWTAATSLTPCHECSRRAWLS